MFQDRLTMKAILTKKDAGSEQVRLDLAWELFFPGRNGKHPHNADLLYPFTNWLWVILSNKAGFMKVDKK